MFISKRITGTLAVAAVGGALTFTSVAFAPQAMAAQTPCVTAGITDVVPPGGALFIPANPNGNNVIQGTLGNDHIEAGAGDDVICGLAGNDEIFGQDGADVVYGQAGNDEIEGGNDNDTLFGNEGTDFMYGNAGDDSARCGDGGGDLFDGGAGGVDVLLVTDGCEVAPNVP
jgi:Ca2+-binding RTX toxin-like protein